MPDQPMPERKSLNRSAARNFSLPDDAMLPDNGSIPESNLAELAALFAANNGGSFSADLALEIVLNEIVEQACLATGATGSAIVLGRDGEMVCRASSGATAPGLGARPDSGSGITGECLRTHRIQYCDDAQADPRADIEASRRLGVRSVMVLPLFRDLELAGVFEVFSTRASAFGERDKRTLEALADRVIKNLEIADTPLVPEPVPGAPPAVARPIILPESTEMKPQSTDAFFGESTDKTDGRAVEVATWALGLTVLACAILLGALVAERLGWMGDVARARPAKARSTIGRRARVESPQDTAPQSGRGSADHASSASVVESSAVEPSAVEPSAVESSAGKKGATSSFSSSASATQRSASHKPGAQGSSLPPGSLLVYENGREVFRMPPSQGQGDTADNGAGSGVQLAASVDPEGTMELSPAAAEDSLVHRVEPEYPEEARQQQIQGVVVLEVRVGRKGSVEDVMLLSGRRLLANAAIAAVKQWRFRPHLVMGQPVEMQTKVTLNFRLPR